MLITRTTKGLKEPEVYVRVEVCAYKYNRKTGRSDRLCKIQGIQIKGKSEKDVGKITDYLESVLGMIIPKKGKVEG